MSCPKCNGPTEWRGSFARGRLVCPGCDKPEEAQAEVLAIMQRYNAGAYSFHRDWCNSRTTTRNRPGTQASPADCDCGHLRKCPHGEKEIVRRELDTYGPVSLRVLPSLALRMQQFGRCPVPILNYDAKAISAPRDGDL